MPKGIQKRNNELTPIEGGGSGGGYSSVMKELAGGASILGGMYGVGLADRAMTKKADQERAAEINTRRQYKAEQEAGDPNALRLSFEEWKKL
jgi:ABC-type uncharacterized transport system ATPase component